MFNSWEIISIASLSYCWLSTGCCLSPGRLEQTSGVWRDWQQQRCQLYLLWSRQKCCLFDRKGNLHFFLSWNIEIIVVLFFLFIFLKFHFLVLVPANKDWKINIFQLLSFRYLLSFSIPTKTFFFCIIYRFELCYTIPHVTKIVLSNS